MAAAVIIIFDSVRRWTRGRSAPVETSDPSPVPTAG
jgi:hypothetical protein